MEGIGMHVLINASRSTDISCLANEKKKSCMDHTFIHHIAFIDTYSNN